MAMRSAERVSTAEATRKIVLVVEDEPVLLASVGRGLSKLAGIDVLEAASVAEARAMLAHHTPAKVLSDLDLPDGSGIDIAALLEQHALHVPLVFVSAYVGQFRNLLPARAEVFEKPVSMDRLRVLVEERLNGDLAASPFGVADYVQLAGMSRRSVVLEIALPDGWGRVVIRSGNLIAAFDAQGSGIGAFRRLAFQREVEVVCRQLTSDDAVVVNVDGSCESILLDVARELDERESGGVAGGREPANEAAELDPWSEMTTEVDHDRPPSPAPSEMRIATESGRVRGIVTEPRALDLDLRAAFEKCVDRGVRAVVQKDFRAAYAAFREAERLAPHDRAVRANVVRLEELLAAEVPAAALTRR